MILVTLAVSLVACASTGHDSNTGSSMSIIQTITPTPKNSSSEPPTAPMTSLMPRRNRREQCYTAENHIIWLCGSSERG